MDAQEEACVYAVGNPGPGDVAHACARSRRPRHDHTDPCALEQRAEAERDRKVEIRLGDPRDDASRSTTVQDLPRRGTRTDRFRLQVDSQVMARIEHDGRCGSGRRRCGDQRRRDEEEREAHLSVCRDLWFKRMG